MTLVHETVLEAALATAAKGCPVFPCRADNKRPHTEGGFKDASRDPKKIAAWWKKWPNALLGAPTGPRMNAWVLDVDDPALFESSCDIALPSTRRSNTGKGYHLFFAWDASAPVRNAQQSSKGWPFPNLPGAEVRGEGGYVILPPSLHPSGRSYVWANNDPPCEAPDELLGIVRKARSPDNGTRQIAQANGDDSAYGLAALRDECLQVEIATAGRQEGTLNAAALKIGALVAGEAITFETARAHLTAAGMAMTSMNPSDPWTPELVTAKVERGLNDGARTPRATPERTGANYAQRASASPAYLKAVTADDLINRKFDPINYVVPGLIAEGASLFAGKPKLGKSWMAYDFALAVASGRPVFGRIPVAQGDVIYLALEDSQRRLQSRLLKKGVRAPERLMLATEWPDLDNGCIHELDAWADAVASPTLAIIDVLKMVRPAARHNEGVYDADYRTLSGLAAWARGRGIAVLIVHHTRKAVADDPLEEISGTNGLTGAADTVMVLKRDIGTGNCILYVRGRDVEESEKAVRFRPDIGTWELLGDAEKVGRTDERQAILNALRDQANPLSAREISDVLDKSYDAVRKTLTRMAHAGELRKEGRGMYTCPNGPNVPTTPSLGLGTLGTGGVSSTAVTSVEDEVDGLSFDDLAWPDE